MRAKNTLCLRIKPYIQPFERELAFREVRALAGSVPIKSKNGHNCDAYWIKAALPAKDLASRLAYWELVEDADSSHITLQSLRESTVNMVRNRIALHDLRSLLPFAECPPLPNRRCLRYGTHGIHEYRGKFFPQLVKSLVNISGIRAGAVVADPMCGSGTTIVESVLAGMKARGIDMNPLSVMLAGAKTELLRSDPADLVRGYSTLRKQITAAEQRGKTRLRYFESLPPVDQAYLRSWFSDDVLASLDDISQAIVRLRSKPSITLAQVALSNIIRSVSWQKLDDLRVRREIRLDVDIDPKKEFLEELGRSVRAVLAFLYQSGVLKKADFSITEGDARECHVHWGRNSVDLIVTSPPYATALPYLDTDRLSLCYLGLLPRPEHRRRDQEMIGNREITEGVRCDYWKRYKDDKAKLPLSVSRLIDKVDLLNSKAVVGFRRRNLPSLLAKYFFDMQEVMVSALSALKPGHHAFIVVGNNHTLAGGKRVDIMTAELLKDVGRDVGFEVGSSVQMEMLVSRDIFKRNASDAEEILSFRKPSKRSDQK